MIGEFTRILRMTSEWPDVLTQASLLTQRIWLPGLPPQNGLPNPTEQIQPNLPPTLAAPQPTPNSGII